MGQNAKTSALPMHRCALSALASLQPEQAASVLYSIANNPSQLHQAPLPRRSAQNLTEDDMPFEGLTGVAGAILVFEEVIRVRVCLHRFCPHAEVADRAVSCTPRMSACICCVCPTDLRGVSVTCGLPFGCAGAGGAPGAAIGHGLGGATGGLPCHRRPRAGRPLALPGLEGAWLPPTTTGSAHHFSTA